MAPEQIFSLRRKSRWEETEGGLIWISFMDAGIEVPRGEIMNTETVSLRKKSTHTQKKEEMETRAPVRKGRWKQQPLGKKNAQKQTAGYVGSHNIWVTKKNHTASVQLNTPGVTHVLLCSPSSLSSSTLTISPHLRGTSYHALLREKSIFIFQSSSNRDPTLTWC